MRHSLIFAALCLLLLVSWSSAVDSVVAESSAENEEKEKVNKVTGGGVAFVNAVTMTIATELGDKTFCIAAVMAMRYNRTFVFVGALGALLIMTVLSVGIGVAVPTLLPKAYTHYAAAALFAYFGVRLLREAREAKTGDEEHSELKETELELGVPTTDSAPAVAPASETHQEPEVILSNNSSKSSNIGGAALRHGGGVDVESGGIQSTASTGGATNGSQPSNGGSADTTGTATDAGGNDDSSFKNGRGKPTRSTAAGAPGSWQRFVTTALHVIRKDWTILTQAFTLTFLAEWGDRSQIATIAMAAAQHPIGVCLGAALGHALCTSLAVVGGRILASSISERTVALMGGVLFLIFALHSVYMGPEVDAPQ